MVIHILKNKNITPIKRFLNKCIKDTQGEAEARPKEKRLESEESQPDSLLQMRGVPHNETPGIRWNWLEHPQELDL